MTERIKKEYKHGVRTQTPMTFRLDNDLKEWLSTKPNKSKAINDLIREAAEKKPLSI